MKGREHDFIAFNTQSALLSNLNIRKAIAYSIDKSNIVSSIYGDKYYQSSFPLDYGSWVYKEQDSSSGYNLEQAKQILVDDGAALIHGYYKGNICSTKSVEGANVYTADYYWISTAIKPAE